MPFRTARLQTNQKNRATLETRPTQSHAALTEVILRQAQDRLLVIAEPMPLRQHGITVNTNDTRRTLLLNRLLDASCLHGLSPAHVFADVKYNKPFPRQFPIEGIVGERACEYRKSARLDYALGTQVVVKEQE